MLIIGIARLAMLIVGIVRLARVNRWNYRFLAVSRLIMFMALWL
jgi:hypothetical protein